jgi:hypothetical protein
MVSHTFRPSFPVCWRHLARCSPFTRVHIMPQRATSHLPYPPSRPPIKVHSRSSCAARAESKSIPSHKKARECSTKSCMESGAHEYFAVLAVSQRNLDRASDLTRRSNGARPQYALELTTPANVKYVLNPFPSLIVCSCRT